jgi:hypothetical protein
LKQFHGSSVSKNMRRDTFCFERSASLARSQNMLGEQQLHSVSELRRLPACLDGDVISSPIQVERSGAARMASSSGRSRKWTARFAGSWHGIAKIRRI